MFDPEEHQVESSEDELDEGQFFRKKAREQPSRKVLSDVDGCDLIDKIVVAHKGKVIPCWLYSSLAILAYMSASARERTL